MRKNIFEIYNEQHANDAPKVLPNENYVKTENPEVVKADPEVVKADPETKTNDVTNSITTSIEDVGKSSLIEERGEDVNGV